MHVVRSRTDEEKCDTSFGLKRVRKVLTQLKTRDAAVYQQALTLFPHSASQKYCENVECTFNSLRPGSPARRSEIGGSKCLWCDPVLMESMCKTKGGIHLIRKTLRRFYKIDIDVYTAAKAILHKDISVRVRRR